MLEDVPDVDVVVVPVGGGGLDLRHRDRRQGAAPDARVIAVEPERSRALHAGLEAGRAGPGRAALDRRRPQRARRGRAALALCRELGVEVVLVTEDEIEEGFRFLYERAKLACEAAGAATAAALLAGKVAARAGRTVVAVVSGGNVAPETAAGILACAMKTDIHPDTSSRPSLLLREHVRDPLDEARAPRRDLLGVPPVLHGQAEAHGHRRPRRALPAPAREGRRRAPRLGRLTMAQPIGGQAVLEGVMMRGPRTGPSPCASPTGEIAQVCRPIDVADGAPPAASGCR